MRSANTDLVVNGRRYIILKVNRFNATEGWASYQVFDAQTKFQFHVSEFLGEDTILETARRKVEKLARMRIQGIPLVYDSCLAKEKLFVVTDSIKGYTLREYLAARNGPARDELVAMVEYGRRLCAILSRLHPNFVHRCLQPENIVVTGNRVSLTDLGFAFMPRGFEREKLLYRAPEQRLANCSEHIGCWTDIYGFGVIFGEMLTGECFSLPDYDAGIGFSGWGQSLKPKDGWHEIPGELKDIVLHCIQELPSCRPKHIEDVKSKLSEWLLFRTGERMGTSDENIRYPSLANSSTVPVKVTFANPRKSRGDKNWLAYGKKGMLEQAAGNDGARFIPHSWLSKIGPVIGSFYVKAILRIAFVERRDTSNKLHADTKTNKPYVQWSKYFASRRTVWGLVLLVILLPTILLKQASQPNLPVAQLTSEADVVNLKSSAERQDLFNELSLKYLEFNSLLAAYKQAKIPGSPEETAQNFRYVESRAKVLHQSLSNLSTSDKELTEVRITEMEMFDALKNAAEIFADYLEGKKKLNHDADWVEEADMRYLKAIELQTQLALKLDKR